MFESAWLHQPDPFAVRALVYRCSALGMPPNKEWLWPHASIVFSVDRPTESAYGGLLMRMSPLDAAMSGSQNTWMAEHGSWYRVILEPRKCIEERLWPESPLQQGPPRLEVPYELRAGITDISCAVTQIALLLHEQDNRENEDRKMSTVRIPDESVPDKGFVATVKDRAVEALSEDIPNAGWRIAGRRAIDRSAPVVLKALTKAKAISPMYAKIAGGILEGPVGSGIYGLAMGTLLSAHPRAASRPWLARLAAEMRVEGWARLGGAVVDPALDALEAIFLSVLDDAGIDVKDPPQFADGARVPVSADVGIGAKVL